MKSEETNKRKRNFYKTGYPQYYFDNDIHSCVYKHIDDFIHEKNIRLTIGFLLRVRNNFRDNALFGDSNKIHKFNNINELYLETCLI